MEKVKIRLNEGQEKAWLSKARVVSIISGIGAGKTFFGPLWLYREIQEHPKSNFLAISPTYMMYERVMLPRVTEFFNDIFPGEYEAVKRVYNLPTGAKIYFGSADKPLTLEGIHVHACWLDEAGQMKREAWDVAQRRIGFFKGRILITTTPYLLNWLKTDVYDRWKAGDPDYEVVQFPSTTNPYFPKEEYERAKQSLPEWKFKMFYEGQFARPEGLVYWDFSSDQIIEPFEIPQSWRRIVGLDWGYTNPTAILWLAISNDGIIYIYREYYQRGKLPEEVAKDIKELSMGEDIEFIACDPSNPAGIQTLKMAGLPARPAENNVTIGISKVTEYIREKKFFVFKGLANFLDEIESYRWAEGVKEIPVKEYDHLMDAMRYAVYSCLGAKKKVGIAWV